MKIAIITISKVNNYGAELQSFALQNVLVALGYRAEILDYPYYKNDKFKYTKMARPFVTIGLKRQVKELINPLLYKLKSLPHRKAKLSRDRKFAEFHQKNTRFSNITFLTIDELYKSELDYDVFMVGSDQVWNPYTNVSLKPYFLTFAPARKRKVSYAASFGVSTIPMAAHEIYRECLNNLDFLSVREEQGVKLVKELTGRDACHVLDPTLLMNDQDWRKVSTPCERTKPYILLYVLTHSPYITELAKKMAADLGWDLVRICKNAAVEDKDGSITNIIDAGPAEYVGLFLNASFVLTNSFHGTAFSVNFSKPFYTILPEHKPNNSRQEGLLGSLDLGDRIIKEGDNFPDGTEYFPDFTQASSLLQKKREQSLKYLQEAIGGDSHE